MANVTPGQRGSQPLEGTVYCYTGTGAPGSGTTKCVILPGNEQTQMAIITIPRGKVGFVRQGEAGMQWRGGPSTGTEFARLTYRARAYGQSSDPIAKTLTLMSASSPYVVDIVAGSIPALTDIVIRCEEVSTTLGVWANLEIDLVDEDQLTDAQLAAIGQPGYSAEIDI